jgi:hypothetical protein
MSKNTMREAIIAQFSEPPKVASYPFFKIRPATRKGKTLADFYTEVFKNSVPHYETKSAKELEVMMMQNRKLIETKNKRR